MEWFELAPGNVVKLRNSVIPCESWSVESVYPTAGGVAVKMWNPRNGFVTFTRRSTFTGFAKANRALTAAWHRGAKRYR
jgi:hypothetical protein